MKYWSDDYEKLPISNKWHQYWWENGEKIWGVKENLENCVGAGRCRCEIFGYLFQLLIKFDLHDFTFDFTNNDEHNHFGLVHEARHQIEDQGLLQWVLISEVLMHHVVKTILNARLDVSPCEMGSYSIFLVPIFLLTLHTLESQFTPAYFTNVLFRAIGSVKRHQTLI